MDGHKEQPVWVQRVCVVCCLLWPVGVNMNKNFYCKHHPNHPSRSTFQRQTFPEVQATHYFAHRIIIVCCVFATRHVSEKTPFRGAQLY